MAERVLASGFVCLSTTCLAFFPGYPLAMCFPLDHKRTSGRWGILVLVGPVLRSTMTWLMGWGPPSWWSFGIWSSCSTTGNGVEVKKMAVRRLRSISYKNKHLNGIYYVPDTFLNTFQIMTDLILVFAYDSLN